MTVPRIIPRAEHPISRGYIDPDALRVLYRLHRAGFKAYLVGGSVRDLMTGRTPKDFDIGTDARPQEVRRLFRNSRVIGRRFRLAHILFDAGKIVEVSTFRKRPEPLDSEQAGTSNDRGAADEDLLIRSDNTFGSPEEDALRRDFTINGLFYDIATYDVIDYVGGVEDLEKRLVRTIGEPAIRFREDPVRMMRACEFAGRLDFEMTDDLLLAIGETRTELRKSAASRVTEELLDPLRRGWGTATYRLWSRTGILDVLIPELDRHVAEHGESSPYRHLFWKMVADADERRTRGEFLPEAALLGILFLPLVFAAVRGRAGAERKIDPSRILLVLEDVINPPAMRLSLPNLTVHLLKQGLYTMGRLAETRPGDPAARRIVGKAYFPIALALLSAYSRASGRYRDATSAWEDVVARAGYRMTVGEDLSHAAPFPEALLPPALALDRGEIPPAHQTAGRRPSRRRRGGRSRASSPAPAAHGE
jgi:poly(A) polymerase